MEDLDLPRVVPGAADDILFTLEALGFTWDGEVLWQSRRREAYAEALDTLRDRGLIYPCACSRREILASAPHPGEDGPVYPRTCRSGLPAGRSPRAMRIIVPEEPIVFTDGIYGEQRQRLATEVGDFVLRRADGLFAYQLAVVVDDAASGVNQVVRGADLLASTPRQIFLLRSLGLPVPDYLHLPLALAGDGSKISKRHGVLTGTAQSGRLLAEALRWLGQPVPDELAGASPAEILSWGVAGFDAGKVPARWGGLLPEYEGNARLTVDSTPKSR
jgi:glutamyl-Q tRNA(Asp) synthetase